MILGMLFGFLVVAVCWHSTRRSMVNIVLHERYIVILGHDVAARVYLAGMLNILRYFKL